VVDYHFEEVQKFRVEVYDVDDKRHLDDLSKHDFIGEAQFTLADVVTAGKTFTRKLTSSSEPFEHLFVIVLSNRSSSEGILYEKTVVTMPYFCFGQSLH